jgi:hypothetical protein
MDMFKMIKEAAAMKSRLNQMEKLLRARLIEVEVNGVKVKMNGKGELLDFKLSPEAVKQDTAKLEKNILNAVQQGIKKSQEVMAEEAKKITGGLSIPGLT